MKQNRSKKKNRRLDLGKERVEVKKSRKEGRAQERNGKG